MELLRKSLSSPKATRLASAATLVSGLILSACNETSTHTHDALTADAQQADAADVRVTDAALNPDVAFDSAVAADVLVISDAATLIDAKPVIDTAQIPPVDAAPTPDARPDAAVDFHTDAAADAAPDVAPDAALSPDAEIIADAAPLPDAPLAPDPIVAESAAIRDYIAHCENQLYSETDFCRAYSEGFPPEDPEELEIWQWCREPWIRFEACIRDIPTSDEECLAELQPRSMWHDTDEDGLSDHAELWETQTNPCTPCSEGPQEICDIDRDHDGDGIPNGEDMILHCSSRIPTDECG